MGQIVLTICLTLAAARLSWAAQFVINSQAWPLAPSSTPNNKVIPVLVGGTALAFTPNSVTAKPGDVLQFQFAASNHSVTQSLAASPCQPIDGGAPGTGGPGVNSGFIPFADGSGTVGTFNVPVMSAQQPMFLYCAQATHCQQGMVMAVNAQPTELIAYFNAAAAAPANIPARAVAGGIAGSIPLAVAVLPRPPPATTATATATATVFTTITVPPSSTPALPPPPPPPVLSPPPVEPVRGGDGADPAATTMFVIPA